MQRCVDSQNRVVDQGLCALDRVAAAGITPITVGEAAIELAAR